MGDPKQSGPDSKIGWGHGDVFIGQDTYLSQCLSPPESTNGYQQIVELA